MKKAFFCALMLVGSVAMADEAELKTQMHQACAPLFATGGACADVIKGTRNCVRANLAGASEECAEFEKEHGDFFDAGKDDPIIHK